MSIAHALDTTVAELTGEMAAPLAQAPPSPEASEAEEEERREREKEAGTLMRALPKQVEEVEGIIRDGAEGFPIGAVIDLSNLHRALGLLFAEITSVRKPSQELTEAWRRFDEAYEKMRVATSREAFPKTQLERANAKRQSDRWEEAQRKRAASEGTSDASAEDAG